MVTVCNNALKILEVVFEKTVSFDRVITAPDPQEGLSTNGDTHKTMELSLTQANETVDNNNDQLVVEKIIRYVMDNADTKYVVRLYGYRPGDDMIEPGHDFSRYFMSHYWKEVSSRKLQKKSQRSVSKSSV